MSTRSLAETLRRRVAPVAFIGALALLGTRTCATDLARVELRIVFGATQVDVQSIRVDVMRADATEVVAYFERHFRAGRNDAEVRFTARLDPGTYQLAIEVQLADGTRALQRAIHVRDQAQVTINLARDLR